MGMTHEAKMFFVFVIIWALVCTEIYRARTIKYCKEQKRKREEKLKH